MNDNAIKEPKQINMSYNEMTSKFRAVERKGEHLPGYIVFTADSFGLPYDERSRTYGLSSTEDGGKNGWKIERCYVMSDDLNRVAHLFKCERHHER